ncbi:MAG: hypothetical protein RLZZ413_2407, partial [Pseudomonadota bacterium]
KTGSRRGVTGHHAWQWRQRCSHLRQTGDTLAEWEWHKALSIWPAWRHPYRLANPA